MSAMQPTTPKGRISERLLFHLPEHIYGSADSCIPTALHLPLSGGSVNYEFRLILEKPYEGRTTLILNKSSNMLNCMPRIGQSSCYQLRSRLGSSFCSPWNISFILGACIDIQSWSSKTCLGVDPHRGDCNHSTGTSSQWVHVRSSWTTLDQGVCQNLSGHMGLGYLEPHTNFFFL
jgi:hypothetical protein